MDDVMKNYRPRQNGRTCGNCGHWYARRIFIILGKMAYEVGACNWNEYIAYDTRNDHRCERFTRRSEGVKK